MPVTALFPVDDDDVLQAAGVNYLAINEPFLIVGHNGKDNRPIEVIITSNWEDGVSKELAEQSKPHFSDEVIAKLQSYVGNKIYTQNADLIARIIAASKLEDDEDEDGEKSNSKAKIALNLAQVHSRKLFLNESGQAFAAMKIDAHVEIHPMDERRFRNWISSIYYREEHGLLSEEDIKKVVRILEAQAEYDSNVPRYRLDVRVRGYNRQREQEFESIGNTYNGYELGDQDEDVEDFDEIYYDLTNRKWEAIRVTAEGWEIVKEPPILFRRYGGEKAQPHPNRNYRKDVLAQFIMLLNVKNPDHITLLKGKLPSYIWPSTIPKFMLNQPAAHGSGKTTMEELIKDSIDPNTTKTASIPKELFNLKQYLAHNYISFFDNVSYISDEQSDTLCRAVTGSGDMKRILYKDDEDMIYSYRRIVGLNGINNAATRPDLLDRGVLIDLEEIDRKNRKLLRSIKREYNKLKAELLGFYLDVIVEVLKERQKYRDTDPDYFGLRELIKQTGGLPRMADAAILCEQIAAKVAEKSGEPYAPGDFLRALNTNLETLNVEAIKESLVAEAVLSFMTDRETFKRGVDYKKYGDSYTHWEGSATALLADINEFIETHVDIKINIKSKPWPQDPAGFGKELHCISPNLSALGIKIESDRTKFNVTYNITKLPTPPTPPTPTIESCSNEPFDGCRYECRSPTSSPTPNNDQNHAQNDAGVGSVGSVGKTPKSGGEESTIGSESEQPFKAIIQEAMLDGHSNRKDHCTKSEI